jgi:hypothetical protein
MTDTIQIGERLDSGKTPPTRPLTHLPQRLDAAACLKIIEMFHPTLTVESITASKEPIDIVEIDSILERSSLSLPDKMTFKSALAEHGIISRGRKLVR